MIKNCLHCKQPFETPSANRKYCSRKCAAQVNSKARRTTVTLNCAVCDKPFTAVPSEIENGYGKYCSRDCANVGKQKHEERTCRLCGKTFTTYPSDERQWCSWECYLNRGKYHATCENCGKPFPTKPILKRKFCSQKCYGEAQRNKVPRTCIICGKEFMARANSVKNGGGNYCSNACKHQRDQRQGKERICPVCGKSFYRSPALNRQYCSRECYNSTLERNTETCETCGKTFDAFPAAK